MRSKSLISMQLYFLLLVLALLLISLQLISGIWLFILKYGITPAEVYIYFTGDEEKFIMAKSFEGLIEIAVPHFMAIGLTLFVYAHFLLFTRIISEQKKKVLISAVFITAIIDIFSPFGMLYGYEIFAWFKVLAFWSFEILMAGLLGTLFLAFFHKETN